MRELIINKFVKNPDNTKDPATRSSYGSVAGFVGIVSNLVLCAFKIIVGALFNSIAIMADGINNLSDAAASLITLFGFKLSAKKPDKDHPYGHGRTEYLTGLTVSVLILAIGCTLLYSSINKTIHPEELEFSVLSIVVLLAAILIKLWQMRFYVYVGKCIDSDALIASSADSRNDVLSTSAVLLSVIIGRLAHINLDGPVGIVVALFILWSGIELIKETVAPIIGKAPEPELVEQLSKALEKGEGVLNIHDLMIHDYGPGRLFGSVHVEVDGSRDIFEIHDAIDNLENSIMDELGVLITVHMDPIKPGDPLTEKVKELLHAAAAAAPGIENVHDVRVVPGPTHTNVVFDAVIGHACKLTDEEAKAYFVKALAEADSSYRAVIKLDRSYI